MTRTFLVTLDLDPASDPNLIAKDMFDSLTYDFPEVVKVEPWQSHDLPGPRPIEGEMILGGLPQ